MEIEFNTVSGTNITSFASQLMEAAVDGWELIGADTAGFGAVAHLKRFKASEELVEAPTALTHGDKLRIAKKIRDERKAAKGELNE